MFHVLQIESSVSFWIKAVWCFFNEYLVLFSVRSPVVRVFRRHVVYVNTLVGGSNPTLICQTFYYFSAHFSIVIFNIYCNFIWLSTIFFLFSRNCFAVMANYYFKWCLFGWTWVLQLTDMKLLSSHEIVVQYWLFKTIFAIFSFSCYSKVVKII